MFLPNAPYHHLFFRYYTRGRDPGMLKSERVKSFYAAFNLLKGCVSILPHYWIAEKYK